MLPAPAAAARNISSAVVRNNDTAEPDERLGGAPLSHHKALKNRRYLARSDEMQFRLELSIRCGFYGVKTCRWWNKGVPLQLSDGLKQ